MKSVTLAFGMAVFLAIPVRSVSAAAPSFTVPATANPVAMVGYWRTSVSANASDGASSKDLVYTWSTVAGSPPVTFTTNGSDAAKNTVASFNRPGTYTLRVTVMNGEKLTATSDVVVTVSDLRIPQVIGDNMVLQQGKPLIFWGQDKPGSKITVTIDGSNPVSASTYTFNNTYCWKATLPAMTSDTNSHSVTIAGSSTVTLNTVMIGDVWLASGQSNMGIGMGGTENAAKDIPLANYPNIRFFRIKAANSPSLQNDVPGLSTWTACSPSTVGGFSGVAYYFSQYLHTNLNLPIGILQSEQPGTPIEPWTSPDGYQSVPPSTYTGKPWPAKSTLYNWMIYPLSQFGIKGVIWYQGEANHRDGPLYVDKMKALVQGWRKAWGSEFPFYFVQIGPMAYPNEPAETLPEFWEAQEESARSIPNTAMAVINDVSKLQLHPRNKHDVGKRLALLALANTYGQKIVSSGPTFQSLSIEDDKIRIGFANTGSGLVSRDGKPRDWFEIRQAGQNSFVPANATIQGDSIVLSAPSVIQPDAVRFAWSNVAEPNLMNVEGLPTGAFRCFASQLKPVQPVPQSPVIPSPIH